MNDGTSPKSDGVRVSPGGPKPPKDSPNADLQDAFPSEPETFEEALEDVHRRYCTKDAHDPVCRILSYSETDVHTQWAVDCREPVGVFSSILACDDQGQAQRLALHYQRPVLRRRIYTTRRFGDWEAAE